MPTAAKIIASIAVVALLVWGGVAFQQYRKCQGIEEDYLNSVSSLKGNAALMTLAGNNQELTDGLRGMQERELQTIEVSLSAIYTECGERAGQSAARKGTEILF